MYTDCVNFEFSLDGLHFYIELEPSLNYRPALKHSQWEEDDLELWRDGKLTWFQMIITSTSDNSTDQQLQHYIPAILLPINDEEELQARIELFLDGPDGLDQILASWEENETNLPDWAK